MQIGSWTAEVKTGSKGAERQENRAAALRGKNFLFTASALSPQPSDS